MCKHVHVPGLGPEIDISPIGVNKGSAIKVLLQDTEGHLGVSSDGSGADIAVFGDAGNDIELFGMKRDQTGGMLEPLGLDFRPAVRVAMPWANDELLLGDANAIGTCNVYFDRWGRGWLPHNRPVNARRLCLDASAEMVPRCTAG